MSHFGVCDPKIQLADPNFGANPGVKVLEIDPKIKKWGQISKKPGYPPGKVKKSKKSGSIAVQIFENFRKFIKIPPFFGVYPKK